MCVFRRVRRMCQRAVLQVQASENGTGPVDPFQREVFNLLGYGAPQKQTLSPVVYPFVQDFVFLEQRNSAYFAGRGSHLNPLLLCSL